MTRRVGPNATPVSVVVTRRGAVSRDATVIVYDRYTGALASIFGDEFLRVPLSNPIVADHDGRVTFYVLPGQYQFIVPSGFDDIEDVEVGVSGSAYPQGTANRGLTGAQGPTGPQGPIGPQGTQGSQGSQGSQGPTGPAGPPGTSNVLFIGAWSSVTTYAAAQEVTYNGEAFVSLQASTNVTPVEGVYWTKVSARGPVGAQGAQGAQGPAGASGPQGPQGPQGPFAKSDVLSLGLTAADFGAVSQFGGGATPIWIEPAVSGSYAPDLTKASDFVLYLTGDTQIGIPTLAGAALPDGWEYNVGLFIIQKVGTGGNHKLTYVSGITPFARVTPTLNTAEGGEDLLGLLCKGVYAAWSVLHYSSTLAIPAYLDTYASPEPPNPPSGVIREWFDSTLMRKLWKDSSGVKHDIGTSAPPSSGVVTAVAGQFATKTDAAAAGSFTIAVPSTPTSGNHVIVKFGTDNTGTITAPAGWTVDKEYAGTHSVGHVGIYRIKSTGIAGDKTATFTFTGTSYCEAEITEYAGMTASPVDQTQQAESTSSTSVTITTGATTVASELAVCAFRTGGLQGLSNWGSSGFATLFDSGAGGSGSKALSATGAVTATPVLSGSVAAMMGVVVTYKAA